MKVTKFIKYINDILNINELKTTAESTLIVLNTTIARASLTPSPDIPIGNANKIIMDNRKKTKKTFIGSIYCPNDKNNKKNSNASKKSLINVINTLYPR